MHDVTLFGEVRCPKTRFYQAALDERGVAYEMAEVDKDADAATRLTELTGSPTKFPTFEIKGRKVRNPKLSDLDKELARADLYDPGLVHDGKSQRFVRHMSPSDAFVSYSWQGDRMVLGHIEVDPSLRGSGIGARLAGEVFDEVLGRAHEIRVTCPFMRRVAVLRPEWRRRFNLGD
ncbi:N-acetyltransferase [Aliiroseovarius sp. Z3]|uniref:N-acetyltransferase n=1 Tax=Aliiroseovarius sp. Z3 TaxID=2811402 RepID=UPI0023B316E9|nr:N-acetyltransferase [Aliiroseovarius sp. Z3]MDE9451921.1 N-acetyltransferase [Aliiroseovarius sp. Z3]